MTSHCRPDPVQKMLNMEMEVLHKMRSPVVSTFVNTENISFERSEFTPPPGGCGQSCDFPAGKRVVFGGFDQTRLRMSADFMQR